MLLKQAAMFYGAGGFRDKFIWDGVTFAVPVQSSPDATRQFNVRTSFGEGGLWDVVANDENLDQIQKWDDTTDPQLALFRRVSISKDAADPIVLWNGGAGADYTYIVTESLSGAATSPTLAFSPGSHAGTDITNGSSPILVSSPYGSPARWEITIASTHNPSGKTRTGTLIFEFT